MQPLNSATTTPTIPTAPAAAPANGTARTGRGTWARVLADSISPAGHRLATVETRLPRIVLAELNTHRGLTKSSASTRAIPVRKQIEMLRSDPFIPSRFPLNQPGMAAAQYVEPGTTEYDAEVADWLDDLDRAIDKALGRMRRGIHKQIASRPLEAWMYHTVIITGSFASSDWPNFFALRCHPAAQPEIQEAAVAIRSAIEASTPAPVAGNEWHLPLTGFPGDEDLSAADLVEVSVARCARASYLTHDGRRDVSADLGLFERLRRPVGPNGEPSPPHMSPFEHTAHPCEGRWANFTGWRQARWYVERDLPLPT